MEQELSLPVAAARLGLSWPVVYRLALSGKLGQLTQRNGRWHVTAAGIAAYEEQHKHQSHRQRPGMEAV